MSTFQVNVTTDSTMPITVNLTSSVPESVFLDCRPRSQNGDVVLLLPASSPGPAQTGTIDCDISLQADERDRTVEFELHDDSGTKIWSSGPVHLKTVQVDESGGFAGFGSAVLLGGGLIALVAFIAFFVFMTSMILKRRRALDILESGEEEVEDVSPATMAATPIQLQPSPTVVQTPLQVQASQQAAPPGPMPGAPGPMPTASPIAQQSIVVETPEPTPAPENFTDAQLMAAGWSQAQILELRGSASAHAEQSVALPSFNCIVTGQVLTANDAWWQCPSCGGFASSVAIAPYTHCPACNAQR